MNATLVIAKRELASLFYSPIAYVVTALFALLAGFFFLSMTFVPGEPAEMRWTFFWMMWILIAIIPAISMRLLAEEYRSGTIEPLLSSPVSDANVVVGKWLGAMGFVLFVFSPSLLFVILLAVWSDPDYGPILTGYVGLMLIGGLYMAIGTFASVLTRNQIIAFLVTVAILLLITVVTFFLPRALPAEYAPYIAHISVPQQFEAFQRGLVDSADFVYFISGIVLFLTLAVKALESRKWR